MMRRIVLAGMMVGAFVCMPGSIAIGLMVAVLWRISDAMAARHARWGGSGGGQVIRVDFRNRERA